MTISPLWSSYFRSLAEEVLAQSNRVRNLIGDRHWPSDGHHKEYLLTSLLQRHLPSTVLVSRGFVVDPASPSETACSPEQDILIVDSRAQGPLFYQGSLVIALPSTIIAAISVKTTLSMKSLRETIENQIALRSLLHSSGVCAQSIWCGAYFLQVAATEEHPHSIYKTLTSSATQERALTPDKLCSFDIFAPDVIAANGQTDFVYTINPNGHRPDARDALVVKGFVCKGLATANFLAIGLEHVAARLGEPVGILASVLQQHEVQLLSPPEHIITRVAQGSWTASGPAN